MDHLNLFAGWIGVLCGMLSGAMHGLFFHQEGWLGGYGTWPRRLTRLGHISFFGLAFINFAFAWSCDVTAASGSGITVASWALIIGAITMPPCCYLAAFFPKMRHLFFIPVSNLIIGVSLFIIQGVWP